MTGERVAIDAALARRLVRSQFPAWSRLPVERVPRDGHDHRSFRLGADLCVRLPSAARYAAQVAKEQQWLPKLAPLLPLPIPVPIAMGVPGDGYAWHWSIYRWLEGEDATRGRIADLAELAMALAGFLSALERVDPSGGPPPGAHNFWRGGPLATYDAEARAAIAALRGEVDGGAASAAWEAALAATWRGAPVWLHGDVGAANLLVRAGRLCGVLDFGCCGVGDPACDLAIAWTLFSGESRRAFRGGLPLDRSAWTRGRGWALWKALITLEHAGHADAPTAARARREIEEILGDHAP